MPISLPRMFRALVLAGVALHVFCMYSIARGMIGGFGFNLATAAIAALFALVMLMPLIWALPLPELPEMYTRHVRARRRYFAGRCAACGYTCASEADRCSECGCERCEPEPYRIKARTVRLFIIMSLLAWLLGVIAAETWARKDEHSFALEAAAHAAIGHSTPYTRSRRWPSSAIEITTSDPDRNGVP